MRTLKKADPRHRGVLWTLGKGAHSQSAEVQSGHRGDVELLLVQDGATYFRQSYAALSLAAAQADHVWRDLQRTGWTSRGVKPALLPEPSPPAETVDPVNCAANYDYMRDDAQRRIRVTVPKPLWTDDGLAIVDRQ